MTIEQLNTLLAILQQCDSINRKIALMLADEELNDPDMMDMMHSLTAIGNLLDPLLLPDEEVEIE